MRQAVIIPLLWGISCCTVAQQVGQNQIPGEPQGYVLKVQSNLVVEAVEVKDKQGHPVHGLSAQDFVLTEDGAVQTVRYCEHQNLTESARPLPELKAADEDVKIYDRLARTQIAAESIDKERYKNRRLLAFYFDMTALPPADQMRALEAAQKFVRTQMSTADSIAILR